ESGEQSMPNFFSAFSSDVFRPLATLLLPGAIGITTWTIAILWKFPAIKSLVSGNHTEAGFVFFLAMVFAGMVFEDFGARWDAYLQIAFKSDPIGRRYARALVLRLKFELGVVFGMISAGLGLIWLGVLGLRCAVLICCGSLCLSFAVWGLIEASDTHKVLSKTRAALLGTIRVIE